MNTDPMTDQVNRLISNLLAAGCDLFLPGIGSLCLEERSARRLSDSKVEPPYRTVAFSPQEQGVSLVDEIARAARCEEEKAQSIYDRWLDNVIAENSLVIEGVGELRNRRFTLDEEFDLQLNPQGHEPVKIRSGRGDWTLWISLLAIVAALAIGYFAFFAGEAELPAILRPAPEEQAAPEMTAVSDSTALEPATAEPAAPEAPAPAAATAESRPAAAENRLQETAQAPATAQPQGSIQSQGNVQGQGTVQAPATMIPGRHYVVGGVFATPENATKALRDIEKQGLRGTVYRFKDKLLVSPFESEDPEACRRFLRAHRDRWPDNWTYTAR